MKKQKSVQIMNMSLVTCSKCDGFGKIWLRKSVCLIFYIGDTPEPSGKEDLVNIGTCTIAYSEL